MTDIPGAGKRGAVQTDGPFMIKTTIPCPFCHEPTDADFPSVVDTDGPERFIERLRRGTFYLSRCPNCHEHFVVMEPTTLIDREHKNVVLCVPVLTPAEQTEYLRNFDAVRVLERFGLDPAEYKAVRVTFRVDDFLEKALMSLGNYDDRVLEYMKMLLRPLLRKNAPEILEQLDTIRFVYAEKHPEIALFWPSSRTGPLGDPAPFAREDYERFLELLDRDLPQELVVDEDYIRRYLARKMVEKDLASIN